MSNMNQTRCCIDCECNIKDCPVPMGHKNGCRNPLCKCHSPKSDQSGWEISFDEQFAADSDSSYELSVKAAQNPTLIKQFIRQLLLSQSNALKEEMRKKVEGMKIKKCANGGFGHEHSPFECQPPQLCQYCKHIEEGKCENKSGLNYPETDIHNAACDAFIHLLED